MNEVGFSDEFAVLISPIVVNHDLDLSPLRRGSEELAEIHTGKQWKKEIHMNENRPKIRIVRIEMEAI